MGLLLYVIMFGAFANLTELPVASEARNVVAKQIDAGFFPAASYTISVAVMHLPVVIVEVSAVRAVRADAMACETNIPPCASLTLPLSAPLSLLPSLIDVDLRYDGVLHPRFRF
jgi:hypothetical protein